MGGSIKTSDTRGVAMTEPGIKTEPDKTAEAIREYLAGNDELLKDGMDTDHPLEGHCYVASEVYFHANGGYDAFDVYMLLDDEQPTHWFLREKATDTIIDLTQEQFDEQPLYDEARGTGFLTEEPSNRAKHVLDDLRIDY